MSKRTRRQKRHQKRQAANNNRQAPAKQTRSVMSDLFRRVVLGGRSVVPITPQTAVCISAVFASVRILSGLLSSLPLKVYQASDSGADVESNEHPVSHLLKVEPNPDQTPAILKEAIGRDYWLFGNSYLEQSVDLSTGETFQLISHHPTNVKPFRDEHTDSRGRPVLKYAIKDYHGNRIIDRSMMAHSPALGFDGLTGASVVSLAAQSMGIALSGDNLAASFNSNAAKPFLIVQTPDFLDDPQHDRLTRDINTEWRGDDAFGSMLLEGGATATTLSIPFKDAQFLESRKFQGEEIAARWFGLPPHLAGYLDRAHFNNVTEQDRALFVFTLAPALVRIEEELNRKLFRAKDRGKLYTKFSVDAILRPQQKERYEAHKSALMSGWKTVNEVRALEDLPPIAGGDVLARPASVFGNDPLLTDPPPDPPADPAPVRSWRTVATDLAVGVLDSLQAAEIHHAERFAKHRDAARVREWYEAHERRAVDKLAPIGGELGPVLDHYRGHRDAIIKAINAGNVPAAIDSTLATWQNQPAALAAALTN